MTVIANPSTVVEVTFEGATGLVGTLKLGIYDGDTVIQALATTAINEIASSGKYVGTRTMPGTGGFYQLVWSDDGSLDPDHTAIEDLIVTTDEIAAVGGSGSLYISSDDLKSSAALLGTTFRDSEITRAVNTACRAIDAYKGTSYFPVDEERIYSPERLDIELGINDLVTLDSVTLDFDGDGVYETTWTVGAEFLLEPVNAPLDGEPYRKLVLRWPRSSETSFDAFHLRFPRYQQAVKVAGTFGWAQAPWQVAEAALLLATRYLKRGEVPFGIVSIAGPDMVAAARLGRMDSDVAALLDGIPDRHPKQGTLQLA